MQTLDPTLPPPTNPDVLTLAVAAAAKVCDRFPDLAESIWLDGIDVEWTYHSFLSEPFYARATPVVCPLNVPVVVGEVVG